MKAVTELQQIINQEIQSLDLSSEPRDLYEPISYILSLGGKRLRPLLVLLAYQLRKDDLDSFVKPAICVELFHNFSLMHDDIMDQAPFRRGQPTVHEKWNQTVGILSGDAMMIKAYELLAQLPTSLIKECLEKFNQCALEVCEGQQWDMSFEEREQVEEEEYLEMIRLKTAVLLGFSLEFGGLLSGMDGRNTKLLRTIGQNMGLGFQLMDDLLDVYAEQGKFGKQVGGDIISNKKTLLLIFAIREASSAQKSALNDWIKKRDFNPEEKVSAVRNLYDQIGVRKMCEKKMNGYFDMAINEMNKIDGKQEAIGELKQFAKNLMNRES